MKKIPGMKLAELEPDHTNPQLDPHCEEILSHSTYSIQQELSSASEARMSITRKKTPKQIYH